MYVELKPASVIAHHRALCCSEADDVEFESDDDVDQHMRVMLGAVPVCIGGAQSSTRRHTAATTKLVLARHYSFSCTY